MPDKVDLFVRLYSQPRFNLRHVEHVYKATDSYHL